MKAVPDDTLAAADRTKLVQERVSMEGRCFGLTGALGDLVDAIDSHLTGTKDGDDALKRALTRARAALGRA